MLVGNHARTGTAAHAIAVCIGVEAAAVVFICVAAALQPRQTAQSSRSDAAELKLQPTLETRVLPLTRLDRRTR